VDTGISINSPQGAVKTMSESIIDVLTACSSLQFDGAVAVAAMKTLRKASPTRITVSHNTIGDASPMPLTLEQSIVDMLHEQHTLVKEQREYVAAQMACMKGDEPEQQSQG